MYREGELSPTAPSAEAAPWIHHRRASQGWTLAATLRLMDPRRVFRRLWASRDLIAQFTRREVVSRYRGSYLGIAWSFLTPFLMLAVFTLVFGVIFQARWPDAGDSRLKFALILFCGLIIFNVFSECVTRAPRLILEHQNLVKKVVFPLEVLPVALLGSALVHAAVGFLVLVWALFLGFGVLSWTLALLPAVLVPLGLWCLGLGWFLASLGIFLRDVGQLTGLVATVVLFLSPIFYPASAIPRWLQPVYALNPLTAIIESARAVVVFGMPPDWRHLLIGTAVSMAAALLGYAWFQRTRSGFADVL